MPRRSQERPDLNELVVHVVSLRSKLVGDGIILGRTGHSTRWRSIVADEPSICTVMKPRLV